MAKNPRKSMVFKQSLWISGNKKPLTEGANGGTLEKSKTSTLKIVEAMGVPNEID